MKKFIYLLLMMISLVNLAVAEPTSSKPVILQVTETTIVVDGRPSQVFSVKQPDGTFGYIGTKGQDFNVIVQNKTHVPLVLHWHGLIDPNDQDGVPYVTQLPIPPGGNYHYHFELKQAGTYWLHSHYKFQEQKLMAAPLIIHDPQEKREPEAVMFVQDFTFKNPKVIFEDLRKKTMKSARMAMKMQMNKPDVNDVKFDAYLVNHRTLQHPDIIRVKGEETLRLRVIDASASSNYYIDLGKLKGELFAVDGTPIKPIEGSRFQMAIGNRLDIRIKIPAGEGAYPILALPEGTKQQTGMILATPHAKIPVLSEKTTQTNPILNYDQEFKTSAAEPMPEQSIGQSFPYILRGNMATYIWTINGRAWPNIDPTMVKPNERTELIFDNRTNMAHPMHIHGHVFEVTEINGKKINGRKGDTIDVLPHSTVKVVLDTDNPGIWMLHCHILYHQAGGMMTTVNYDGYPNKFTEQQRAMGDRM